MDCSSDAPSAFLVSITAAALVSLIKGLLVLFLRGLPRRLGATIPPGGCEGDDTSPPDAEVMLETLLQTLSSSLALSSEALTVGTKGAGESCSFLPRPLDVPSGDSPEGEGVGEGEGTRACAFWASRAAALALELLRVLRRLGWEDGATILGLTGRDGGGGRT